MFGLVVGMLSLSLLPLPALPTSCRLLLISFFLVFFYHKTIALQKGRPTACSDLQVLETNLRFLSSTNEALWFLFFHLHVHFTTPLLRHQIPFPLIHVHLITPHFFIASKCSSSSPKLDPVLF